MIVVSVDSSRKKEKSYKSFCSRHVSCLYSKKANKDFFKMIPRNPGGTLNMMQLANHAWVLREAYYFTVNTFIWLWGFRCVLHVRQITALTFITPKITPQKNLIDNWCMFLTEGICFRNVRLQVVPLETCWLIHT